MTALVRYDGQVAVVTGAGNGLGRAHALLLGSRGAKVVVNDYGPDVMGNGRSSKPADDVVAEIKAAGGIAVANYDGVHTDEGARSIIQTALDSFGGIDILICNAGNLANEPLEQMSDETWRRHLSIHVDGSMFVTRAAWPHMRKRGYGRVVFTSSGGGMFGKAGLTAYGAAKGAIYGFMRCLAQEAEGDIRVNAILPGALTRMLSPDTRGQWASNPEKADPGHVAALVGYLVSAACEENGKIYTVGGGFFARTEVMVGQGTRLDYKTTITPEQVAARWVDINNMSKPQTFDSALAQGAQMFGVD